MAPTELSAAFAVPRFELVLALPDVTECSRTEPGYRLSLLRWLAASHLMPVRLLTLAASLAALTLHPSSSSRLTSRARPLGFKLACLWLFIGSPDPVAEGFDNPSLSNQRRMNNLLERHN
jgi:hypothetical protein